MRGTVVGVKPVFSIVIPAYNEEKRIVRTLLAYAPVFADSEIIVVLDGCTDRTAEFVHALSATNRCVRAIETAGRAGKGGAIVTGMAHATADVVAFTDADGATEPEEMRRLCEMARTRDAVVGSRWLPGADVVVPQPLLRRAASRVFNRIVRTLFGLRVSDTQCGAKAFRADALAPTLVEIETADFAFDVDLLVALARRGCDITEVPVRWRHVGGSKVDLAGGAARMLVAVIRLRLRHSRFASAVPAFDRLFRTRRPRAPLPDSAA
ncbi:MAG TPA: dolichyl-phosphate beta-glucosyltransferase [Candidatus Eremiobacteraceae bacterium]|nr:dolichyl-phosphate beta-glucosyltransferase [Candidatus Eremiobacteraceae bacterium]